MEDNTLPVNRQYRIPATQKVCCCHYYFIELLLAECEINYALFFVDSHATALDADSRFLSAEEQSRELTRSIRREVMKLTEQWNHLINRSDTWKHRLDDFMTVSKFRIF